MMQMARDFPVASLTNSPDLVDVGAYALTVAELAVLRELLPVGADVNGRDGAGRTPLWHAAWRGELGVVLHSGASTTLADSGGSSPLYTAAGQGPLSLVQ